MKRNTISVLVAAAILVSLLITPVCAAADMMVPVSSSYTDAFQCLAEYMKQFKHISGDDYDSYDGGFKLDDYGNNRISFGLITRADNGTFMGNLFPGLGESVPMIEVRFSQENEDHSTCMTTVRFYPQKPDECTVYLLVEPGMDLPWGAGATKIQPARYKSSNGLTFDYYTGQEYARVTYQEYLQESLPILLEYVEKILRENGSDLKSLGFLQFDQHTVHAIDYNADVILYQLPTCNRRGIVEYSCAICGKRILEYIPILDDHMWGEGVVDPKPTCSISGTITYSCVWCGEKMIRDVPVDPNGHQMYDAVVELLPTCTEPGSQTGRCEYCEIKLTEEIPALGHNWDEGVVFLEPGCVSEGVLLLTCARCGENREEPIPDLGGHFWTFTEILTEGETLHDSIGLYTCARCGETKAARLCAAEVFSDVPKEGSWAHDPIDWAYFRGITGGTTANTFTPKGIVTRAEAMTFLWAALGHPDFTLEESPFRDVKPKHWFYDSVLWAVENQVTGGVEPGRFAPGLACSRAQIVTFLWAAAGKPEPETQESPFSDVKENDWFRSAVLWAAENNITGGVAPGRFGPDQTCTRAQAVTFLHSAFPILTAEESPELPEDPTEPTEPEDPTEPSEPDAPTESAPDPENP